MPSTLPIIYIYSYHIVSETESASLCKRNRQEGIPLWWAQTEFVTTMMGPSVSPLTPKGTDIAHLKYCGTNISR